MRKILALIFLALIPLTLPAQRYTISLNGTWDFDQTSKAFPPAVFTRKITVPGLIHMAQPHIDQYEVFFKKPEYVKNEDQFDFSHPDYEARYSWYRRNILIPSDWKGKPVVITIKKSQYVTQVIVNGMDVGTSMACYTPVEFPVSPALKFGEENEILIRVGDRQWLPSEAAGSTDKEKVHYLPGIWDDVSLSCTDKLRIQRALLLPSLADKKVTVKMLVRSFYPPQMLYGAPMYDSCLVQTEIFEKNTGKPVASSLLQGFVKRDNLSELITEIPLASVHPWSPEDPFLYKARITILKDGQSFDQAEYNFGMRDFARNGRFFELNEEKYLLRGSNITLQRFFEDPECANLAWNRQWVTKMLAEIPKELDWNAFRLCVSIVPSFWYDIADSCGIVFQNEWFYWQNHGWDEQVRKEYTDWVWTDGNHPSIVIWDAINENWDPYIGNTLIPELKKLDPTRVWDAGYMTGSDMSLDEMDEPHPYRAGWDLMNAANIADYLTKHPYPLGKLDYWPADLQQIKESPSPQLVNEYGWIWLWRDGRPAKLTKSAFDYFLGENATPDKRREMQAYWLQLETEWLRSQRDLAGVLAFCYLTNNYGFTGDWFTGAIKDLTEGPTLKWFRHCFAPTAVFIDLADERYMKALPHPAGSKLAFNLVGVNDLNKAVSGKLVLKLLNKDGKAVMQIPKSIAIPAFGKASLPISFQLPRKEGEYLVWCEFVPDQADPSKPIISRRYIRIK